MVTSNGNSQWTSVLKAKVVQSFPIATGQGSIQAARGGDLLVDPSGIPVIGEVDLQGNTWNPAAWWAASSALTSWSGGTWMGATWTGSGWVTSDDGLLSNRWSSNRWSSNRWSDALWDSNRWSSNRWSSNRWSAFQWLALLWSATAWA
jgi:serine protease AprX